MNCNNCGSSSMQKRGKRRGRNRYVCTECGKWFTEGGEVFQKARSLLEMKEGGEYVSDKLIEISELDLKDKDKVLRAHGFDPNLWVITAYRHNLWHAPIPGGRQTMYQSRVTVRPKELDDLSLSDIDEFFSNLKSPTKSNLYTPSNYDNAGDVLEIALADLHIDRKIPDNLRDKSVDSKIGEVIGDILNRVKGKKISKIYLVPLGDNIDYDNLDYKTSKGTQQYSSGMSPYTAFDYMSQLFIYAIDSLSRIAPVEGIFIPGNHDRLFSYTVMKSLEYYYRNNDNVKVDVGHSPRKYRKIGNSLVGWMHGDMKKQYHHSWLQNEARALWGQTKYAEVHAGHFHHQVTTEKDGVVVRFLPSTTDPSIWEEEEGHLGNTKSTCSFLWSKHYGLRDIWFTNV